MHPTRAALFLLVLTATCPAGDWPQILGPNRNGFAEGEKLVAALPSSPQAVWTKKVGEGFAGIVVAEDTAYLFHRVGNQERVEALTASNGSVVWTSNAPTSFTGPVDPDNGPRCTPVVAGDNVIVFGAQGLLRCLDRKTGKEVWSNPTHKTFSAQEGYFGAGSTPVVEGDLVLVNVGASRSHAGIVAFNVKTGKVVWKATDEQPSYSSPIVATVGGQRQAIFVTRYNCLAINPTSGDVLWTFPFGARGPTVNAASPVLVKNNLLVTASYGVGAVYAEVGANSVKEIWKNGDLLASQYPTPLPYEGMFYGIDGRDDVGPVSLRCVNPKTKRVRWTENIMDDGSFGYGSLIFADEKILLQKTDGTLVFIKPNDTKYEELSRTKLCPGTVRALPALSKGLYFIRNDDTLYCFNLSG
jgi:outer membrane protein assembly factor BamB